MCLVFIAWDYHPKYRLVIAANRDEFYARPTAGAGFWQDSGILAGQDLLQKGTWLGFAQTGRFGALTNFRDPALLMKEARSRGELIIDFLHSNVAAEKYLEHVQTKEHLYNPFNLIVGDIDNIYYYGSRLKEFCRLEKGLYGLSNHLLDTPWTKVVAGKLAIREILAADGDIQVARLFEVLADQRTAPDSELPDTGIGLDKERFLSSAFIAGEDYGTRSSTVITIDRNNRISFIERSFPEHNPLKWQETKFEWFI